MDKFIPVVVIENTEDTVAVIGALHSGGLRTAEITFRTECAPQSLKLATEKFADMCIGAGTVINLKQCKQAVKYGASFIVSPGISVEVALYCKKKGIPYYPGCVTPTEIMQALSLGITTVKFFPANIYGGLNAIKALSAPFPQVRFVPTGGIDLSNIDEYLKCDKVAAIGGTYILKGDIEANTKALLQKINE